MKSTKAAAHYRDHPNGDKECRDCSMWRAPNSCTAVVGEISPRGWCSYWEEAKDVTKRASGGRVGGFNPDWLIYHDYGGSPENREGMHNPYHALVFPDGSVRYRDPANPYGSTAPHAFHLNPRALGLSYAGPVGSGPTPKAMRALQGEYEKIQARFPGMPGMGHGEAFEAHKAHPFALPRPSRDGREWQEASWRNRIADLSRVPEAGLPALSLLPRSGEAPIPAMPPAPAPEPPRREIPTPMALGRPEPNPAPVASPEPRPRVASASRPSFDSAGFWAEQDRSRYAAGGGVLDVPSAEPIEDLMAQAEDLADPADERQAVWLSRDNIDALDEPKKQMLREALSGSDFGSVVNFDGQGGVLVTKTPQIAEEAMARRDAGEDMQAILGSLTGAGTGKPVDGSAVVQQVTPGGAVTRESAVAPYEQSQVAMEFAKPGREVRTVDPQTAIARRAQGVLKHKADGGKIDMPQQNHGSWMSSLISQLLGRSPEPTLGGYLQQRQMGQDQSRSERVPSRTPMWRDADDMGRQPADIAGRAHGGEVPASRPRDYPRLPRDAVADIEQPGTFYPSQSLGLVDEVARSTPVGAGLGALSRALSPKEPPMRDWAGGFGNAVRERSALDTLLGDIREQQAGRTEWFSPRQPLEWPGEPFLPFLSEGFNRRAADNLTRGPWPNMDRRLPEKMRTTPRIQDGYSTGYADGGAPRSPVPDWLLDQQRAAQEFEGVESAPPSRPPAEKTYGPFGDEYEVEKASYPFDQFVGDVASTGGEAIKNAAMRPYEQGKKADAAIRGNVPTPSVLEGLGSAADTATLGFGPAGGTAGGALRTAIGYTVPAAMGAASHTLKPSSAQAADGESPVAQQRRALEALEKQRDSWQKKMDDATQRMEAKRPKNRAPQEPITDKRTGKVIGDPQFFDAKREAEAAKAELDKLNPQIKEAGDALTTASGGERLKEVKQNKSYGDWITQDIAPWLGLPAGVLYGWLASKGLGKFTSTLENQRSGVASTANKLLNKTKTTKDLNSQITRTNKFWTEGGSDAPPFTRMQSEPYWKTQSKGVAKAEDLYPNRSRVADGVVAGVATGIPAAEGALGHEWSTNAQRVLDEIGALPQIEQTSELNIQRREQALKDKALGDFMFRMGIVAAPTTAIKGGRDIYKTPYALRPNYEKADSRRADLTKMIDVKKEKVAKGKPPTPPKSKGKKLGPPAPNGSANVKSAPPLAGLAGSTPTEGPEQEPPQLISGATSSAPATSEEEPPFKSGGSVAKHHSLFQPRAVDGKWAGGPVYPALKRYMGGGVSARKADTKADTGKALDLARRYANGGSVHAGPVVGHTGGREDALPINVEAGSYVIPAAEVAFLGSGNTLAGMKALEQMFGKSEPQGAATGGAVPIRISDGEYVVSPQQVAKIGRGDIGHGLRALDEFVKRLRKQNIATLKKLPAPAK